MAAVAPVTEPPFDEVPVEEPLPKFTEDLHDALIEFTGCIGNAVDDICSYGFTIGDAYVPFNPDEDDEECEDDSVMCSQVWVRVTNVTPKPGAPEGFGGQDCYLQTTIGLEVGVLRCIEIAEHGEAPTATQVLVAGLQAITDMNAIMCAALSCEVWDAIEVGSWQPTGPLGGQYGGIWTFTVEPK